MTIHNLSLGCPTLWLYDPKPKIGWPRKEYGMSLQVVPKPGAATVIRPSPFTPNLES